MIAMHDVESIRQYCLSKPGSEESMPFGNDILAFKVMGKMFLLLSLEEKPVRFNAKCLPDRCVLLREQHPQMQPGYHMNKRHWNTIIVDENISQELISEWIDHSYNLVVAGLTLKQKALLQQFQ